MIAVFIETMAMQKWLSMKQPASPEPKTDLSATYAARGSYTKSIVDELMGKLLATSEADEATLRASIEQGATMLGGVGGTRWGHRTEEETTRIERGLRATDSIVTSLARRVVPRTVKRGSRIVVNIQQLVMSIVEPAKSATS